MTLALLVTGDPLLVDEVSRLAAAAGAPLSTTSDPREALQRWSTADFLVLGSDLVPALGATHPIRREGVVVATSTRADDRLLRDALAVGAETVVELPAGGGQLGDLLSDLDADPRAGRLVGVIGGSGGAGATTFACALAQVAGRVGPSVVVDVDPFGPGVDTVLGLERLPGVRWPDLHAAVGRLGARSLREALPRREGAAALAWGTGHLARTEPRSLREVVMAARRGHDLTVLDLPRTLGPELSEAAAKCDQLVIVSRTDISAITAARRLVSALGDPARSGLVVRGSAFEADRLATATHCRLIARMRDQRGLRESVDLGLGPAPRRGPLERAARAVVDFVG